MVPWEAEFNTALEGTFDVEGQSVEVMVIPQGVDIVMGNFWKEKHAFGIYRHVITCNYQVKFFSFFPFF